MEEEEIELASDTGKRERTEKEESQAQPVPAIVPEDRDPEEEEETEKLIPAETDALSQNLKENDEIEEPEKLSLSQLAREELRVRHSQGLQSENKVYVTIGRMNPPTPGHKIVIKEMIKEALSNGLSQVSIILSSTFDDDKNLLYGEEKRRFLYKIIDRIKKEIIRESAGGGSGGGAGGGPDIEAQLNEFFVEIICMDDPTLELLGKHPIVKSLRYILSLYGNDERAEKPEIILTIGQDRADDYNWLSKSFSNNTFHIQPILRDVGAISATYVRGLVSPGVNEEENRNSFFGVMRETGLTEEEIGEIYKIIHDVKIAKGTKKQKASKKSSAGGGEPAGGEGSAGGRTKKLRKRYKTKRRRYRNGRSKKSRSKRRHSKRHCNYVSSLSRPRSH